MPSIAKLQCLSIQRQRERWQVLLSLSVCGLGNFIQTPHILLLYSTLDQRPLEDFRRWFKKHLKTFWSGGSLGNSEVRASPAPGLWWALLDRDPAPSPVMPKAIQQQLLQSLILLPETLRTSPLALLIILLLLDLLLWQMLIHAVFKTALLSRWCYTYSHFTDEETCPTKL